MDIGREPVHIVVDDREQAGDVPAALATRGDATVEVARLDAGDYCVQRRVLVERKTVADFAASLIDGRLFRQTATLAAGVERGVLLLEGGEAEWQATGVRREALQGALITVGVFYGLALLWSAGPEETARLLVYLGRQTQRFIQGGLARPGYRPKGRRARQLFVLQGLPGVGPERAVRLLERFGSVRAIVTAPTEELALVPGIGEKTAAKMRWILDGPAIGAGQSEEVNSLTTLSIRRQEVRHVRCQVRHAPCDDHLLQGEGSRRPRGSRQRTGNQQGNQPE